MTDPGPGTQEQQAIEQVLTWLSSSGLQPPEGPWRARPLEDGWVVRPVTRARGTGTFVVRGGAVRHVPSNRVRSEADVLRELATEQEA